MSPKNQQNQKPLAKEIESADPFGAEQAAAPEQPAAAEILPGIEAETAKTAAEAGAEAPATEAGVIAPAPVAAAQAPVQAAEFKSEQLLRIESILEEDMKDTFFKLEPKTREKFKIEGEKTSKKIEQLLSETKVKTHKIFKAIYDWLRIIPGINKFFLRQEAKIKTDKILRIK